MTCQPSVGIIQVTQHKTLHACVAKVMPINGNFTNITYYRVSSFQAFPINFLNHVNIVTNLFILLPQA